MRFAEQNGYKVQTIQQLYLILITEQDDAVFKLLLNYKYTHRHSVKMLKQNFSWIMEQLWGFMGIAFYSNLESFDTVDMCQGTAIVIVKTVM